MIISITLTRRLLLHSSLRDHLSTLGNVQCGCVYSSQISLVTAKCATGEVIMLGIMIFVNRQRARLMTITKMQMQSDTHRLLRRTGNQGLLVYQLYSRTGFKFPPELTPRKATTTENLKNVTV